MSGNITRGDIVSSKSPIRSSLTNWNSKYNTPYYRRYVYDRLESFLSDPIADKFSRLLDSVVSKFNSDPRKYSGTGTGVVLPGGITEADGVAEDVRPASRWQELIRVSEAMFSAGFGSRDRTPFTVAIMKGEKVVKTTNYPSFNDLDQDRPKIAKESYAMGSDSRASLYFDSSTYTIILQDFGNS